MTGYQVRAPRQLAGEGFTAGQLAGDACIVCGVEDGPLNPAGTMTVSGEHPEVVHDHDTVICPICRASARYRVEAFDADDMGRVMFGIRDMATGGQWVETGGEVVWFPLEDSAEEWPRRQKYLNETVTFGA
jgi:hypothetical protein